MRKLLLLAALTAAIVAIPVASASADYGKGAYRQIELSANIGGRHGGGVWLWIVLNSNGKGDYAGSDCGHGGVGAASDKGDVEWERVGSNLMITGVVLNGLEGFPTTVTVPAKTGHYKGTVGEFLTLPAFIPPNIGNSQLQVAP
jgi:hypothetical protein